MGEMNIVCIARKLKKTLMPYFFQTLSWDCPSQRPTHITFHD